MPIVIRLGSQSERLRSRTRRWSCKSRRGLLQHKQIQIKQRNPLPDIRSCFSFVSLTIWTKHIEWRRWRRLQAGKTIGAGCADLVVGNTLIVGGVEVD